MWNEMEDCRFGIMYLETFSVRNTIPKYEGKTSRMKS